MKSFSRSTRIALLGAGVLALFVGVAGAGVCPWDCQPAPNGSVDVPDLLTLLSQWGAPGSCDFDGCGTVTVADLLSLLAHWGTCM